MRALLYHDVDKELAEFVRQVVENGHVYRAVTCIGGDGEVVASAGAPTTGGSVDLYDGPRIDVVPASPDLPLPALRFAVAVPHPDARETRIGVLLVLLEPERLRETIAASIGPDPVRPWVSVRTPTGDAILETDGQVIREAPPDSAGPRLQGRTRVEQFARTTDLDLDVVVSEPREVALADVAELRRTLFHVGEVVLILGSVLGVLIAWRISLPIRRLTTTVRAIAARGRLEEPVVLPRAIGEVGVLSDAFRSMMHALATAQNDALVQSRRALLGDVAASMAHDVRTPLSVLKTAAQLFAKPDLPPAERAKLAAHVAAEVDRLNRVVTSLVDLARPRPVHYRDEWLSEIVERASAFFAPYAAKQGVSVTQAIEPIRVHGSADQLHQVCLNAIHNGLQAMAADGELGVQCYRDGNGLAVVEITDTGPGFAPAVLARPFSPFVTTKVEGTGLGLAIMKRIVEEHGGTITLENRPGGGACVRIRLPARPAAT
jgi:signal transduction histidine kinase